MQSKSWKQKQKKRNENEDEDMYKGREKECVVVLGCV